VVGFNVRGRDVQSIVKKLQGKVEAKIKFPAGYYQLMAVLLKLRPKPFDDSCSGFLIINIYFALFCIQFRKTRTIDLFCNSTFCNWRYFLLALRGMPLASVQELVL
jgi:hypothetical protein